MILFGENEKNNGGLLQLRAETFIAGYENWQLVKIYAKCVSATQIKKHPSTALPRLASNGI